MKIINIADLIISPDRQRRSFEPKAIEELANSIESKGLMHPIVVRNDNVTLVAGERRFRAIQLLYANKRKFRCNGMDFQSGTTSLIPVLPLSQLSPLDLEEAELEENVIRKDLSWQEFNSAIARLHKLREAQNGSQPMRKTAEEIFGIELETGGPQVDKVRNALVLADHLSDPEVALAPDARSAMKIIEKRARAKHNALLASEFIERKTPHEIIQGSAFTLLKTIENNSIDIIITDPPYGIDADRFGSQADASHDYTDSREYGSECYRLVCQEANRVCRESAFLFAFCDIRMWPHVGEGLDGSWTKWATPLIWDKGNGMLPVPDRGPRRCYEAIFYAYRGTRPWTSVGMSDVYTENGETRPVFGAQKPVALYRRILACVARPGDTILDPFAGTGPVIGAATSLTCKAIAFELAQEKVDYMRVTHLSNGGGDK